VAVLVEHSDTDCLNRSRPTRLALEEPRQIPDRRPEITHLDILSNPLGQLVGDPRGSVSGVDEEDRGVVVLMTDGSSYQNRGSG